MRRLNGNSRKLTLLVLIAVAVFVRFGPLGLRAQSPYAAAPVDWKPGIRQILIRYGVTDAAAKVWHGWVEPAAGGGKVLTLRPYRFQQDDVLRVAETGAREFAFTTRSWAPATQQTDLSPILPAPRAVFPNGYYAVVSGGSSAQFHVVAAPGTAGDFTFRLGDLDDRKLLEFDKGNIQVEESAVPYALSEPAAGFKGGEADFPALAIGPAGRIAVVWQEFTGDRDRIVSREWDGTKWGASECLRGKRFAMGKATFI